MFCQQKTQGGDGGRRRAVARVLQRGGAPAQRSHLGRARRRRRAGAAARVLPPAAARAGHAPQPAQGREAGGCVAVSWIRLT